MEFTVAQVQEATGARLSNEGRFGSAAMRVRGWSIDSRSLNEGDLFFAIQGEHFDGHNFLAAAFERGAVAAVVSGTVAVPSGPLLTVPNTLEALQRLARWARQQWRHPLIAVTGSAGKTSTKDIIAELLSVRLRVAKTIGNFNNHIGLPLSLLRIPADAEIGVLEMGMNHAGEIRDLTCIARPQIGVVTNVGYAHVESYESIDGVAAAKRELIEGLSPEGAAVLNADDPRVLRFRDAHRGRTVTYGMGPQADVRAEDIHMDANSTGFSVCGVRFETRLQGRHGVLNVLAGIAVAELFGIELRELVPAVARLAPGKMRGERHEWRGAVVLNDCYNSNPEAARSMIDVLKAEPAARRIAVLGEMLELGHMTEPLHRELGRYAAAAGIDILIGVQGASRVMVEEAKTAGLDDAALFFDDAESAGAFLREFVKTGDAILFKGSRGTHVERALSTMEF